MCRIHRLFFSVLFVVIFVTSNANCLLSKGPAWPIYRNESLSLVADASAGTIVRILGSSSAILVSGFSHPIGVALEYATNNLIVSDNSDQVLYMITPSFEIKKLLTAPSLSNPSFVYIDQTRRRAFLTDEYAGTHGRIFSINLADLSVTPTMIRQCDSTDSYPRGIAGDPENQHLYYTSWNSHTLSRLNYDGTGKVKLFDSAQGLYWSNSVALDLLSRLLYLIDASTDWIYTAFMNGTNFRQLVNITNHHGCGIALKSETPTSAPTSIIYSDWSPVGTVRAFSLPALQPSTLFTGAWPMQVTQLDVNTTLLPPPLPPGPMACPRAGYFSPRPIERKFTPNGGLLFSAETYSAVSCLMAYGDPTKPIPDPCIAIASVNFSTSPCGVARRLECLWTAPMLSKCNQIYRSTSSTGQIAWNFPIHIPSWISPASGAPPGTDPSRIYSYQPIVLRYPTSVTASTSFRVIHELQHINYEYSDKYYSEQRGGYRMVVNTTTNYPYIEDLPLRPLSSSSTVIDVSTINITSTVPSCIPNGICVRTHEIFIPSPPNANSACGLNGNYTFMPSVRCRAGTGDCPPDIRPSAFSVNVLPDGCPYWLLAKIAATLKVIGSTTTFTYGNRVKLVANLTSDTPLSSSKMKSMLMCQTIDIPCNTSSGIRLIEANERVPETREASQLDVQYQPGVFDYYLSFVLNKKYLENFPLFPVTKAQTSVRIDATFNDFAFPAGNDEFEWPNAVVLMEEENAEQEEVVPSYTLLTATQVSGASRAKLFSWLFVLILGLLLV